VKTVWVLFVSAVLALSFAGTAGAQIFFVANVAPHGSVGLGAAPSCTITCPGPDVMMLRAVPTTSVELDTIANLTDRSVVRVVLLDPDVPANATAISEAEGREGTDIDRLRAAIDANADFQAQLQSRDVPVASVLAADVAGNGSLILFAKGASAHSAPITFLLNP